MSSWFLAGYVTLGALLACESLLLYAMMRATLDMHRASTSSAHGRLSNYVAPAFRAAYVSTRGTLTQRDLTGERSALIFIRASDALGTLRNACYRFIASASARFDARRCFVICRGSKPECAELSAALTQIQSLPRDRRPFERLSVVIDETGAIATRFGVDTALTAIALGANGCVVKTGTAEFQRPKGASLVDKTYERPT